MSKKSVLRSVYKSWFMWNFASNEPNLFLSKIWSLRFKAMTPLLLTGSCTVTPENGIIMCLLWILTWILINSSVLYIQFILLHTYSGSQISVGGEKHEWGRPLWLHTDHTLTMASDIKFHPKICWVHSIQILSQTIFCIPTLGPFFWHFDPPNSKSPPFIWQEEIPSPKMATSGPSRYRKLTTP